MKSALDWVMASRWRAMATVLVLAVMPLLGILAAALVALTVLRHGLREGLVVAAGAAAGLLALDLMFGGSPQRMLLVVAINWAPVIVLALILARTSSQARVLQMAAVLGCGAVAGLFAAVTDPAPVWEQVVREQLLPLLDRSGLSYDRAAFDQALPAMAAMMTGLASAFWVIGHYVTVALARWAQAAMVNPGGFRREFHALRLGGVMTLVAGAVFITATLVSNAVVANLALVLVLIFAVQGIAVVHGVVDRAQLHWAWLIPPYLLLSLLPPHMLAMLSVMGFIDHWIDFRGRVGKNEV